MTSVSERTLDIDLQFNQNLKELHNTLYGFENDTFEGIKIDININGVIIYGAFFLTNDKSTILLNKTDNAYTQYNEYKTTDILPEYFNFFKGILIVESFEVLKKNINLLVNYLINYLLVLKDKFFEKYNLIYLSFNLDERIKQCILDNFNYPKINNLVLFKTTKECYRKFSDLEEIFFLYEENTLLFEESPYLEYTNANKIEVILCSDRLLLKILKNLNAVDLKKDGIEIEIGEKLELYYLETQKHFKETCAAILEMLNEHVCEVRVTKRLINAPCFLINSKNPNEKKKIFELNPNNLLVLAILDSYLTRDINESLQTFNHLTNILFETARIRADLPLLKPANIVSDIYSMLIFSLDISSSLLDGESDEELPDSGDDSTLASCAESSVLQPSDSS